MEKPEDVAQAPFAVLVCENPHSHPDPSPVSTPPPYEKGLTTLLYDLGWEAADATPRRLANNPKFLAGLTKLLPDPPKGRYPVLAELHPSLANADHARVYIEKVRLKLYPNGTDFKGEFHIQLSSLLTSLLTINSRRANSAPQRHGTSEGSAICSSRRGGHVSRGEVQASCLHVSVSKPPPGPKSAFHSDRHSLEASEGMEGI